jgi:Uma2 family endonuclease
MVAQPQPQGMSPEAYLAWEAQQTEAKHEYAHGEIVAMSGASWAHNVITANIVTHLSNALRERDCLAVASDMRLFIASQTHYRYPDAMVICGQPDWVDGRNDTLSNPTLVVEVLSPSTALTDVNEKLSEYLSLPSVQDYLIVSQDVARIQQYQRQSDNSWLYSVADSLNANIALPSLDITLPLEDVYRKVTFSS